MAKHQKTWLSVVEILQFIIFWSVSVSSLKLPENYDRALRPNNDAVSDYVKVNAKVLSIRELNEDDLTVDLILRSHWVDPRLANLVSVKEQIFSNELPAVWLPDLFVSNSISITQPERHSSILKLTPDGTINHLERLAVKLSCKMTYKKFPFDKQGCPLTLQSFGYTRVFVDLIWHGIVNEDAPVFDSEYSLSSIDQSQQNMRTDHGEYAQLTLTFNLCRSGLRLVFRAILPAFIFALLSYSTLFIKIQKSGATDSKNAQLLLDVIRFTVNCLAILSLVMVSQTSALGSPTSATVTAVDVWISVAFIIIFIAFGFSLIRIVRNLKKELPTLASHSESSQTELSQKSKVGKPWLEKVEQYFRISLPVVFVVFSIIYFAVYLS